MYSTWPILEMAAKNDRNMLDKKLKNLEKYLLKWVFFSFSPSVPGSCLPTSME